MHILFFRLLLIFLPTQLGLHFWPEWTIVLGRRIDYLSPTIYLTDIFLGITVLSWFIESYLHKFLITNFQLLIKRRNFQFLILKLILIVLFVGANIFVAANRPEAIYKWIKVLEYVGLGWYIVKNKPHISTIAFPLSIGVFYSSILAIAQFLFQHSIGGSLWWLGERTFTLNTPGIARINWCSPISRVCQLLLRPYATFPHPNVLGGYLAAMLPLLVVHVFRTRKIFYGITIVAACVALIFTFSRSAWIMGALGTILTIAKISKGNKQLFSFLLAIFFLTTLFVAMRIDLQEESIVVREQLTTAAIHIWQQSPLFGVGLGNFLAALPAALPSRQIYFLQPVHNIYLMILVETGVIGLVIFLLTVWAVFRKKQKFHPVLFSFGALLMLGFIDHYMITLQQGQLLFIFLLSTSMYLNEGGYPPSRKPRA